MLDSATLALVTQGFEDMLSTVTQVLAVAIPVMVGVITLTAGVGFAMRKLRGILGWA